MDSFVRQMFGFHPAPRAPTEVFRAATALLVWAPAFSLLISLLARYARPAAAESAVHWGLQAFMVALLTTLSLLLRLPTPRAVRLAAVPALLATLGLAFT